MSETKRDEKFNIELTYTEETVTVPTETPVEKKATVYIGTIRDCGKLNVRSNPASDAKILCRLDKDSEVIVDKSNSTKEYYKICLASGVEGYCMKKYMSIKKREV